MPIAGQRGALHWCLKRWSCSDGAVLLMHAAFKVSGPPDVLHSGEQVQG